MTERRYHKIRKYNDVTIGTATTSVIVSPLDISDLRTFAVSYHNHLTAIAFLDMIVQVAHYTDASAADTPPVWVAIPTTTLSVPSALAPTASVITPVVTNAWNYLRVLGRTSQTASLGTFSVTIGGF